MMIKQLTDNYTIKVRTINGSDNNGDQGEANIQLIRLFNNAFEDGISIPRGGPISEVIKGEFVDTSTLPNPRTISNIVADQVRPTPNFLNASNWLWQWGQVLDHDFALNEDNPEQNPRGEYTPIVVPNNDPYFPNGTILPFIRVPAAEGTGDTTPRQVNNQITAFIDGSLVYGSDEERAEFLRDLDSGKGLLKTTIGDNGEVLLGRNLVGEDAFPNATGGVLGDFQFIAGDVRVNEQIGLTAAHNLLVREHNRIALKLHDRLEDGDEDLLELFEDFAGEYFGETSTEIKDEFLYQSARKVVGAEIQAISYNEFVPLLVGDTLPDYKGFDSGVSPQISVEFANAAFRLGHTLLTENLYRVDGNGIVKTSLGDSFFDPNNIQTNGVDNLLTGLIFQTAEEADNQLVDGVRNFLFLAGTGGLDLASVNIARGREVGIPSYTEMYDNLFGEEITTFDDLGSTGLGLIDDAVVALLEAAYETVDQIDLWLGGISELPDYHGGILGPTLSYFVADQFTRSRDGDEFFYLEKDQLEHLQILDPDITRSTLADLIRDNVSVADGYLVPDNAFIKPFENEIGGNDTAEKLSGTGMADLIDGQGGNDNIRGGSGADILLGGLGNDTVEGNRGDDKILGGDGDDKLHGDSGNDTVVGGSGDDILFGDGGNNLINGQSGSDVIIGGGGQQTFVFASDILGDNLFDIDLIQDFQKSDFLDFSDYLLAGGTISFDRINNELLEIDLSGEDQINVLGSKSALDAAESQVVFGVPDLEIGLYDTDSDTLITPIKNNDVIPASILLNRNVTIAAFVPQDSRFFGDVESMFLDLNEGNVTQTENVEPYAIFGDIPPGDFQAGSGIPLGDNSISFKLYSEDNLRGDFLGTVTRSFSIVENLLDIGIFDADSDELITPLNEGDELLASTLKNRNVTIAAFVPEDSLLFNQVKSMGLNLNDGEVIRTENMEPYSLFGDINGNYSGGALPFGDNRIAFELYPDNNLQGHLLGTVIRNFTIINDL